MIWVLRLKHNVFNPLVPELFYSLPSN